MYCKSHWGSADPRYLFSLSNIKEDQTDCLTSSHCCKPTYFKVFTIYPYIECINRIGVVMICMFTSSMVDRDLESRSCQTNDYKIGICCFSAKHSSCRSKSNYWFARNHEFMSEWSDLSIHRFLFQWTSTMKIKLSVLV